MFLLVFFDVLFDLASLLGLSCPIFFVILHLGWKKSTDYIRWTFSTIIQLLPDGWPRLSWVYASSGVRCLQTLSIRLTCVPGEYWEWHIWCSLLVSHSSLFSICAYHTQILRWPCLFLIFILRAFSGVCRWVLCLTPVISHAKEYGISSAPLPFSLFWHGVEPCWLKVRFAQHFWLSHPYGSSSLQASLHISFSKSISEPDGESTIFTRIMWKVLWSGYIRQYMPSYFLAWAERYWRSPRVFTTLYLWSLG